MFLFYFFLLFVLEFSRTYVPTYILHRPSGGTCLLSVQFTFSIQELGKVIFLLRFVFRSCATCKKIFDIFKNYVNNNQ